MASKKARKKLRPKEIKTNYLNAYVSCDFGFKSFRILNGDNFDAISERNLIKDGKQCWFDISNVRNEVEIYAKERDLSTSGLDELYQCIDDEGFSYSHKDPDLDKVKSKAIQKSIILID
jgi:hypothetical protein